MPRGGIRPICTIDGCSNPHKARGYCDNHYENWIRTRDPLTQKRAPNGSGTLCKHHGYRSICVGGKQVKEHRWLMEEKLGRKLLPHENVHHINGVKHDNRLANLELWSKSQPWGQRVEDKLAWAREIIALYG